MKIVGLKITARELDLNRWRLYGLDVEVCDHDQGPLGSWQWRFNHSNAAEGISTTMSWIQNQIGLYRAVLVYGESLRVVNLVPRFWQRYGNHVIDHTRIFNISSLLRQHNRGYPMAIILKNVIAQDGLGRKAPRDNLALAASAEKLAELFCRVVNCDLGAAQEYLRGIVDRRNADYQNRKMALAQTFVQEWGGNMALAELAAEDLIQSQVNLFSVE